MQVGEAATTALCRIEPWRPHALAAQRVIAAFCRSVPSGLDPAAFARQVAATWDAVEADDEAAPAAPLGQGGGSW